MEQKELAPGYKLRAPTTAATGTQLPFPRARSSSNTGEAVATAHAELKRINERIVLEDYWKRSVLDCAVERAEIDTLYVLSSGLGSEGLARFVFALATDGEC